MNPPKRKTLKLPKLKPAGLKKAPQASPGKGGGSLLGQAAAATPARLTRWPAFDKSEMAFRAGELALVCGRSGHGKSNFLINLLHQWMSVPGSERFLYYSLEMTPSQAAARLLTLWLASHKGISMSSSQAVRHLRGELKAPESVEEGIAAISAIEERVSFVYEPLWDVDRLAADIYAKGGKVGAVFVDPLSGLAAPPGRERGNRRDLELSHVSRRLKEIAVRLNCPVIGAAPSRPLAYEEGEGLRALIAKGREFTDPEVGDTIRARRPRLSHLPEGSLEQEADLVLGLLSYLSDFQQEMEPDHRDVFTKRTKGVLEVSALKNRLGPLESAELEMDSKTSWIRDNPDQFSN